MPRTRPPYPPEFRQQMVELVRAGESPEKLAKRFEPSAQAIRKWVEEADLNEGRRADGLTPKADWVFQRERFPSFGELARISCRRGPVVERDL